MNDKYVMDNKVFILSLIIVFLISFFGSLFISGYSIFLLTLSMIKFGGNDCKGKEQGKSPRR